MTTTIKIQLDKRTEKQNKNYPIVFKITHNRIQTTIGSGYEVTEENFNTDTKSIKRSTNIINKDKANRILFSKYTQYSTVINNLHEAGKLKHLST